MNKKRPGLVEIFEKLLKCQKHALESGTSKLTYTADTVAVGTSSCCLALP